MNQLISIIIPTYNTSQYLPECISSVLNQTYQTFEILLVDDGSEDDTLSICYEEAKKDHRIHVFSNQHLGTSVARNTAMKYAKGKYFLFLDSDDVLHPCFLELLYKRAIKTSAEVVGCKFIKVPTEKMKTVKKELFTRKFNKKWISVPEKDILFAFNESKYESTVASCKIISKELIGNKLFKPGINLGEDTLFMYALSLKGFKMEYIPSPLYLYRMHNTSTTHQWESIQNRDSFKVYEIIRDQEYVFGRPKTAQKWIIMHIRMLFGKYHLAKKEHQVEIAENLKEEAFKLLKRPDFPQLRLIYYIAFQFPFLRYVYKIPKKIYRYLFKARPLHIKDE